MIFFETPETFSQMHPCLRYRAKNAALMTGTIDNGSHIQSELSAFRWLSPVTARWRRLADGRRRSTGPSSIAPEVWLSRPWQPRFDIPWHRASSAVS
jgi:hypothetical protein